MTRVWRTLGGWEKAVAIGAISLMSLLPVIEMVARLLGLSGIPGSVVFVQQLTLWVAFLGAALAATGDRLLSLSANTFLPEKWTIPTRVFGCGLTAAIAASLCWASCQFVVSERAASAGPGQRLRTVWPPCCFCWSRWPWRSRRGPKARRWCG
jgi:C4-dicarboxylate transporter DctM subunit